MKRLIPLLDISEWSLAEGDSNPPDLRAAQRTLQIVPPQFLALVLSFSVFWHLEILPSHQDDWFPQFHTEAQIRFTPSIRRLPLAQSPSSQQIDPKLWKRTWFRQQISGLRRVNKGSGLFVSLIFICPGIPGAFTQMLTTIALDYSSFE